MNGPAGQVGIFDSHVVRHQALCREHFQLTLGLDSFPSATPGQFVNLLCRDSKASSLDGVLLRRPFSIAGFSRTSERVEIDIIGRAIGPGTRWLDARRSGDRVNLIGPLGRGFTLPNPGQRALLIAGGVGWPPIRWWGEILNKNGVSSELIYGAQSRDLLPISFCATPSSEGVPLRCVAEFERFDMAAVVTTDDGSCGLRGRVTDALERYLTPTTAATSLRVYTCGPEPMLRAVAEKCAVRGIPCETAMERVMGCGMGTCQSCVVPVRHSAGSLERRFALCCREGPVFDAAAVCW